MEWILFFNVTYSYSEVLHSNDNVQNIAMATTYESHKHIIEGNKADF